MKYTQSDNTYILRLDPGDEIIESIRTLCDENNIKTATIQGIGAVNNATLGYIDLRTKEYVRNDFEGDFEIANLTGNTTILDEGLFIHCHITLADTEHRCIGGHLVSGIISATCEIFVTKLEKEIRRRPDEKTGLNILDL